MQPIKLQFENSMLSIIICSKDSELSADFTENVKKTVGVEYELVLIDNSDNRYSIFSAYNEGVRKSKYPCLCFVHDDVIFHSNGWGKNVISHLNNLNTGIIGLAGGDMAGKVPSYWYALNRSSNLIQSDWTGKQPTHHLFDPEGYDKLSRSVIILDGVFLCARKNLFEKKQFDESIGGFHGYDIDICLQSVFSGYHNYVIYDVLLEHLSMGNANKSYYENLMKVHEKWNEFFAVFEHSIPEEFKQKMTLKLEEHKLKRLRKKLIRAGFPIKFVNETINGYIEKIGSKKMKYLIFLQPIHLYLIKFTSIIRKKQQ